VEEVAAHGSVGLRLDCVSLAREEMGWVVNTEAMMARPGVKMRPLTRSKAPVLKEVSLSKVPTICATAERESRHAERRVSKGCSEGAMAVDGQRLSYSN
jgi:hypothetical protein